MSNFYEDASVVMVPSGYKDQKVYSSVPDDGSADLTFSRSNDTATRVGPDGLIEKVRTNEILYSEDFTQTNWDTAQVSVTANTIANPINGATTADTLTASAGSSAHYLYDPSAPYSAGENTISIYAKYNNNQWVCLQWYDGSSAYEASFDIQNGVAGAIDGSASSSITSIGSGWYRISLTATSASGGTGYYVIALNDTDTASLETWTAAGTESAYIFGAQLEAGVMTDYIATTSSAVSVGPVSGLPRLDYSGGANSPSLLLEPQRTNLALYSERLASQSLQGTVSVSSNAAVSPDGYQNADKLIVTTTSAFAGAVVSGMGNDTYSVSMFAKAAGKNWVFLYEIGSASGVNGIWFNVANGTIGSVGSAWSNAKIENYGNDWYRVSATTTLSGGNYLYWLSAESDGNVNTTGSATDGVLMWGLTYEAGAYATSYIPTLSAAVTRGADNAVKTGIGSLLSASEYTLYWEGTHIPTGDYNSFMTIYKASDLNASARFYRNNSNNEIRAAIFDISVSGLSLDLGSGVTTQTAKCALRVKAGDYAFYVNGNLVNSNTSALAPSSTLDAVNLQYYNSSQSFDQKTGQVLFFKSALSNANLATLTTL